MKIEYTIIESYESADVELAVTNLLNEGWELCGNLVVAPFTESSSMAGVIYKTPLYCQVMTRKNEN